jgi:hypothetical protein
MGILAAEYTAKSGRFPALVTLNNIVDGRRNKVIAFRVTGKREARQIARAYSAKCWNF